jgi:hypothetical protein
MPACSRNQSPYHLREPWLNEVSQDDGVHLGSDGLDKSTRPGLNALEEDDIGQNNQQHQEVEEEQDREHCKTGSHLSSNESKGTRPTRRRRPPPSRDYSIITQSRKCQLQHSSLLTTSRHRRQLEVRGKDDHEEDDNNGSSGSHSNDNYIDGQDSDDGKMPRLAKRRKLAAMRPQLGRLSSLQCSSSHQVQKSLSHPQRSDNETTCNTQAEYREWPIHGVFKRTVIGNEIYYGMEFSLEESREFSTSHATLAGSDRHFSATQTGQRTIVEAHATDGIPQKKRRGRPRKHV